MRIVNKPAKFAKISCHTAEILIRHQIYNILFRLLNLKKSRFLMRVLVVYLINTVSYKEIMISYISVKQELVTKSYVKNQDNMFRTKPDNHTFLYGY